MPRTSKNSRIRATGPAIAIWSGDCSGSMNTMGPSPLLGAREFIKTHIKLAETGTPLWLHFSTFNHRSQCIYSGLANDMTPQDIDNCVYAMSPGGGTRFFDTVVEVCDLIPHLIQKLTDTFSKEVRKLTPHITVSTTIMTDGVDNQSTRHNHTSMRDTIHKHRTDGCVFIFLGANQDANTVGIKYGFDPNLCLQVGSDPQFSRAAFTSATSASARALSSQVPDFVGNERSTSCSVGEAMRYSHPLLRKMPGDNSPTNLSLFPAPPAPIGPLGRGPPGMVPPPIIRRIVKYGGEQRS